jgi:DNA (cytosine-5)-methyltransferase 1
VSSGGRRVVRALDVCCGAGGCSVGYARAGFDVTGVDLHPQPRYPFLEVIQADALAVLADVDFCRGFDLIHLSAPCQLWSALHARCRGRCRHVDLITPARPLLERIGRPYVIENVVGAPLRSPLLLCGSMFGLGYGGAVLRRHRLFESSHPLAAPGPCRCSGVPVVGVYGTGGGWTRTAPGGGGVKIAGPAAAAALGVDWTTHQASLAQMVPPAYTEWLGRQLLAVAEASAA